MKSYLERFKFHGLFIQMFLIIVISILSVSILISWSTIRISERLFINTFSITNAKVINQIKSGFESFNYSIVASANNIQQSGSIKQFLTGEDSDSVTMSKLYYNMTKQMKQFTSNLDAFGVEITIIGSNGRSYSTNHTYWAITDEELKGDPITTLTLHEPKRLLYQFHSNSNSSTEDQNPVIVATKALMERSSGKIYGVMYFAIHEEEFKSFYESYTSTGNNVVVLNKSGVIVSSNRQDLIGRAEPDLFVHAREVQHKGLDYTDARFRGKDQIVLSEYLSFYDMYLVNLIDKQWALGQLIDTKATILICFAIVIGALMIVFLISRRLTKSLTRLVKQISTISNYEFHHYVTVTGSYETRQLAQAFNGMLDELHEYVEKLVQTQKKQRNAELAALQRQINPHFLYNTLASVKIMVQQGGEEKAAETINALISLLQNSIGNVSETVTVEQEMETLKHYVFINQVRYGDRIKVQYFISPECINAVLPKLIIQPFIENAFFHAFNTKQAGNIYVVIVREGNTLVCEVADNGDGMGSSDSNLSNTESKRQLFTGIGIRNVDDRLALLYGQPYGVTITSESGRGTQIKIKLPYRASQ